MSVSTSGVSLTGVRANRNHLGTISLVTAAAGYLAVTLQPWLPSDALVLLPGLGLKRLLTSFFEASLVGALADWFAVSALFTNPLGIKLPHTDILARHKDSLAEAVPRFLTSFVTPERITAELTRIDFAGKAVELLASGRVGESAGAFLRTRAPAYLKTLVESLRASPEGIEEVVRDGTAFILDEMDTATAFSGLLRRALRERAEERLLTVAAGYLGREIERNRTGLVSVIKPVIQRNAGLAGLFIGKGTIERMLSGVQEELGRIQTDPDHPARAFVTGAIEGYAARLAGEGDESGVTRERFVSALRRELDSPAFRRSAGLLVGDLFERLGADLGREDGRSARLVERLGEAVERRLAGDAELRDRLNRGVAAVVIGIIERTHLVANLTDYLAGLLKATDEREFVRRVEGAVWNDLQYIRVNGAVVGGLVGVVLAFVRSVFPA